MVDRQPNPDASPDYGIDAPHFVLLMEGLGLAALTLRASFIFIPGVPFSPTLGFVLDVVYFAGVWLIIQTSVFIWSSRIGKLRLRDRMLNVIQWKGDERVLDVGCGRGLLLNGAAKRLREGASVGVDIWSSGNQSDNAPQAALANATLEGVLDKTGVTEGDARKLPFADSAFDVVLSSLVIHNIRSEKGRIDAINEMIRVLKPGGRVAIYDIRGGNECYREFERAGMSDVQRSSRIFLFMMFGRIVTATK